MTDETLEEFLNRNKDKIEYVVLIWWYPEKRSVQSNKVYVEEDGQPVPLEMAFDVKVRDWEYCFIGEIDDSTDREDATMTRILRGCSSGANSDLCDSCESYWKAEGEKPPCEGCKIHKSMNLARNLARIIAEQTN